MNEQTVQQIRGTNLTLKVNVKDSSGDPFDLTGAIATLTVKRRKEQATATFSKVSSSPSQASITNPRGGQVEFYVLAANTSALDVDSYVYDVKVLLPNGAVYVVVPMSPWELRYNVG